MSTAAEPGGVEPAPDPVPDRVPVCGEVVWYGAPGPIGAPVQCVPAVVVRRGRPPQSPPHALTVHVLGLGGQVVRCNVPFSPALALDRWTWPVVDEG